MIRSIAIQDLQNWGLCHEYSLTRVEKIQKEVKLGKRATAKTLYRRLYGVIPDTDLIWLLCHKPLLSERQLRLFAADCAARALLLEYRAGRKPDKRSYAAVRAARLFAYGKISASELATAAKSRSCRSLNNGL